MLERRAFIGLSFLTATLLFSKHKETTKLSSAYTTISKVHEDLFVQSGTTPKLGEINAVDYLFSIILVHSRVSQSDKKFILNGAKWLNEEAMKSYHKEYVKLDPSKREKLLKQVSKTKWGDSWIYEIMTYMFEAMLGDPIYKINKDEVGWRWLGFSGGLPRPKKAFL